LENLARLERVIQTKQNGLNHVIDVQKVAGLGAIPVNGNRAPLKGLPNKKVVKGKFRAVNRRSRAIDIR